MNREMQCLCRFVFRLAAIIGIVSVSGCARSGERMAADFIAYMDAKPPEERVPNWETTKALMLRQAPIVGDAAPDFSLQGQDGSGAVRLSSFKGDRPVVLIFGSWT